MLTSTRPVHCPHGAKGLHELAHRTDVAGRFSEASQAIAQQNATLSGYVESTAALIKALGLVKPTVIGWSMGGNIALGLAEQYTDLFTSVVATGLPQLG